MTRLSILTIALTACASSHGEPPSNRSTLPEPAPAVARRVSGTIGGRPFSLELAGDGVVLERQAERWRWRLATGVLQLTDAGPRDRESRFQIARSPRTIVRQRDGAYAVITEVVVDAGGRIFACLYEEPVAEPDSAAGRAAMRRGVASCTSLRVDPR